MVEQSLQYASDVAIFQGGLNVVEDVLKVTPAERGDAKAGADTLMTITRVNVRAPRQFLVAAGHLLASYTGPAACRRN